MISNIFPLFAAPPANVVVNVDEPHNGVGVNVAVLVAVAVAVAVFVAVFVAVDVAVFVAVGV